MTLAYVAVVSGLVLLAWSADRFVEGSATTARHFGVPPLLIGMAILGFGTSAPEMVVSAFAASQGNPGVALGNAYGSNIANIGLILGVSALVSPVAVRSRVLRQELPVLTAVTGLVVLLIWDGGISRVDGLLLLGVFAVLMVWTIRQGLAPRDDALASGTERRVAVPQMAIGRAMFWVIAGVCLLVLASSVVVWGAVEIAHDLGISDLVIGLTVVAVGTSLPELASSIAAVRKGEHDIAVGNVIGSNLFNTLVVIGIAGSIHPIDVPAEALSRDSLVLGGLTVSLFVIGYGFRGQGRVNRFEGAALLACYLGYNTLLAMSAFGR
jgi:cation:H+ antiporter